MEQLELALGLPLPLPPPAEAELLHNFEVNLALELHAIAAQGEGAVRVKLAHAQKYLEDGIAQGLLEEFDIEPVHTFAPQVYIRELSIPKGQLIAGKIHRYAHFNFISKGRVTVLTKDGVAHYVAPCQMISSAGTQRLLYTHEDTVWTVVHPNPTNTTDLEELEAEHIAKDFSEFPLLAEAPQLLVEGSA